MSQQITREAALRIVLAAQELEVAPRELTKALAEKLELPLTETKLAGCSVEVLRAVMDGDGDICIAPPDNLKRAVRLLWGEGVSHSELPQCEPYQEGDLPGSVRLACASNNGEELDGHFGSCERFLIYQVSPEAARLIAIRPTLDADTDEDKNAGRTALIADCQLLYVQSIGGPAAAKVVRANIHPVKIPRPEAARTSVAKLQQSLRYPPPWLAHVMGVAPPSLQKYAEALAREEA